MSRNKKRKSIFKTTKKQRHILRMISMGFAFVLIILAGIFINNMDSILDKAFENANSFTIAIFSITLGILYYFVYFRKS